MRILGIDPGSRITGYGIIDITAGKPHYVTSGVIRLTSTTLADRLTSIFENLSIIIETHTPTEAAIEQVFMHANAGAALKLGQARGAAIVAAARHVLHVGEYSARQVKQSVVGYGNADKLQVQAMVMQLLRLAGKLKTDAADALAIALCHYHSQQGKIHDRSAKRDPN
jgi:crossover junction endodeoxyribonuclease RuvC